MSDSSGGPTPDGPQFNPQSAYPIGQEPPGQAPPPTYGQAQYGQPYGQQQYGQPQYGQQQYVQQQPGYGQPYHQPFTSYVAPDHPKATTALVLGLVSVVGGLMCGLPLIAAPFAWVTGMRARREIRESNGQLGGDGSAQAGMILGIVGTVLLTLALIGVILLIVLFAVDAQRVADYGTV
ncbi:DUF4190 domain-containing protein [Nocardioides marmorisolisilvae]|uniref:DUF4190 domain-containing protein n=1 Tax=Nocardioides marmorisolisilvae TaxID=1542737 RepID=A0A3N0DZN5_9ACTN|nr:DUF4190 domain-containing protein [Nocardioides marmorisolisilvae]RNL81069.1 DUF4190 domain-containing protein [Nocardioides marmorisolisilvae]